MASGEIVPAIKAEPCGFTTTDLIALSVGVAVAVQWELSNPYLWRAYLNGQPPSIGWLLVAYLHTAVWKVPLALLPVIIARRMRSGGPLSAIEFLATTLGWRTFFNGLWLMPLWGAIRFVPARGLMITWEHGAISVKAVEVMIAVVCLLLGFGLRKRIAPWLSLMLISITWSALTSLESQAGRYVLSWFSRVRIMENKAAHFLWSSMFFPLHVLMSLPIFIAILSTFRPGRQLLRWYGWILLTFAVGYVGLRLDSLVRSSPSSRLIIGRLDPSYEWSALGVALAIAFWLTRDRSKQVAAAIASNRCFLA